MPGRYDKEEESLFKRWRRSGKLRFEEALLEAGFSEMAVDAIQFHLTNNIVINTEGEERIGLDRGIETFGLDPDYKNWEDQISGFLPDEFGFEEARCILLAVLGRQGFKINFLQFNSHLARARGASTAMMNKNEIIAFCVNLASNRTLTGVDLSDENVIGTREGCILLANALTTNFSLTYLSLMNVSMGSDGAKALVNGLQGNTTLTHLDVSFNPLLDEGVGHISDMLRTNTTLSHLYMYLSGCGVRGAEFISSALESNSSLKFLEFGDSAVGRAGIEKILATISRHEGDQTSIVRPSNTTLTGLSLSFVTVNNFCSKCMSGMIRSNESLSYLRFYGGKEDPNLSWKHDLHIPKKDWLEHIIPALMHNQTLAILDLSYVGGLQGTEILEAFMELGRTSITGLGQIMFTSTGMSYSEEDINGTLIRA